MTPTYSMDIFGRTSSFSETATHMSPEHGESSYQRLLDPSPPISGRHRLTRPMLPLKENEIPSAHCLKQNPQSDHRIGKHGNQESSSSVDMAEQEKNRELSKKRSHYYESMFAYREPYHSARERVSRDSIVMAELTTNVILEDEFTIITDLSSHLSQRYQRPETSICVTVHHSACMMLSGSFDPAYVLTITALPCQIAPATNKRNVLLTQAFLKESIRVPENRGIIRFNPVLEENLAFAGRTVLGEIEHLEHRISEENGPSVFQRSFSRNKNRKKKSLSPLVDGFQNLGSDKTRRKMPMPALTVARPIGMPRGSDESSTLFDREGPKTERPMMKARKSIMALFGRSKEKETGKSVVDELVTPPVAGVSYSHF